MIVFPSLLIPKGAGNVRDIPSNEVNTLKELLDCVDAEVEGSELERVNEEGGWSERIVCVEQEGGGLEDDEEDKEEVV